MTLIFIPYSNMAWHLLPSRVNSVFGSSTWRTAVYLFGELPSSTICNVLRLWCCDIDRSLLVWSLLMLSFTFASTSASIAWSCFQHFEYIAPISLEWEAGAIGRFWAEKLRRPLLLDLDLIDPNTSWRTISLSVIRTFSVTSIWMEFTTMLLYFLNYSIYKGVIH